MANFFETLVEVLKADERLFSQDGSELLRNKVYELAMAMDAGLLALLLGNEETRSRFFTDVNGKQNRMNEMKEAFENFLLKSKSN